jgi:hypothetical protein
MKFKVEGAFKSTGADINLVIEASDQCHAERIVNEMGILFSSLQPEISELNTVEPKAASAECLLPKPLNPLHARRRWQLLITCIVIIIELALLFVPPWKGIEGVPRVSPMEIDIGISKPWYDEPKSFVGFYGIFRKAGDKIKSYAASIYSVDFAVVEWETKELKKNTKPEWMTEESIKKDIEKLKQANCKRIILGEVNVHLQIIFCLAVLFIGGLAIIIVGLYPSKISKRA